MKFLFSLFLSIAPLLADEKQNEFESAMQENIQNYLKHNDTVVDIAIFQQSWKEPSKDFPKGQLTMRAVVTHAHKGTLKIGDKVEFTYLIEEAPKFFDPFTSTVEGKLKVLFFSLSDSTKSEGYQVISGDAHWGFSRTDTSQADKAFQKAFALEMTK